VVEAAINAIAARPRVVVTRARRTLSDHGRPSRQSKVLVIGVSYKPGLGDVGESPALEMIDALAADGVDISYSDPYVDVIATPAAGELLSLQAPAHEHWVLAILHTAHLTDDYSWLVNQPAALDATYKSQLPGAYVL
jgi:UDP-N-acetyl-D-mannosaminuronate dehydrogenase